MISVKQFPEAFGLQSVLRMADLLGDKATPTGLSLPAAGLSCADAVGRREPALAPSRISFRWTVKRTSPMIPRLLPLDPAPGTPFATTQFNFVLTHNDTIINDPSHPFFGSSVSTARSHPRGQKWFIPLPPGKVQLEVHGIRIGIPFRDRVPLFRPSPSHHPRLHRRCYPTPSSALPFKAPESTAKFHFTGHGFLPKHQSQHPGANDNLLITAVSRRCRGVRAKSIKRSRYPVSRARNCLSRLMTVGPTQATPSSSRLN